MTGSGLCTVSALQDGRREKRLKRKMTIPLWAVMLINLLIRIVKIFIHQQSGQYKVQKLKTEPQQGLTTLGMDPGHRKQSFLKLIFIVISYPFTPATITVLELFSFSVIFFFLVGMIPTLSLRLVLHSSISYEFSYQSQIKFIFAFSLFLFHLFGYVKLIQLSHLQFMIIFISAPHTTWLC